MTRPEDRGDVCVKKTGGAGPSDGRWRMVIVDDSKTMLYALRRVFSTEQTLDVVGEGENGLEAVSLVQELHPDAVVMDISMPVMDGVEATRKIKAESPDTVVVGLSMGGTEDRRRIMEAGAVDFVRKSDPAGMLVETVLHALAAHAVAVADASG